MKAKNSVHAIRTVSIDVATFTGVDNWIVINDEGFSDACFMIRIINNSDTDASISYNGSHRHDFAKDGETVQILVPYSKDEKGLFSRGTILWAAGEAQGTGRIYVVGYYRDQSRS